MDEDTLDEDPALEGPDYVALVIEWDQIADSIESEIQHEVQDETQPVRRTDSRPLRVAATAAGALGALALAVWGIRRLRAA